MGLAGGGSGPRTLRLDLEFDGAGFEGWQRQAAARTVQGEVEAALERVLGSRHAVLGSSRTDAGVHAYAFVASVRTEHAMASDDLARALDAVLPDDIGVRGVRDVPATFHAQRDAVWKWYRYEILVARRKHPLLRGRAWRLPSLPELEALSRAASAIEGRHDFRSFANVGSSAKTTVRTIHRACWSREEDRARFDVVGDGFLYKMVRNLVGSLIEAASEDDPAAAVRAVLAARDRRSAGRAAPPWGLFLMAVAVRGEPAPAWVPRSLRPRVHSDGHSGETSREAPALGDET